MPAGLSFDAATRTLSGTPTEAGAARSLQYTATDADPVDPDTAGLTFTIQVSASAADKAILNDALAAQGRALLTSATSVIGERFRTADAAAADLTAPRIGRHRRDCAAANRRIRDGAGSGRRGMTGTVLKAAMAVDKQRRSGGLATTLAAAFTEPVSQNETRGGRV